MIPKIIYYAWFGKGKKSELEERCISSWREKCPNYQIIEINENNFDIENWHYLDDIKKRYIKEAYAKKNYSFVADVARMEWLRFHNGFMFDADIELLDTLEVIRRNNDNAFIGECHRGFYENGCVGISNGLPDVLIEAYKKLTHGKAMYVLVNEEVYKRLKPHGQTYIRTNECSLYGIGYIGNAFEKATLMVHHDENTWTKKDTLGFKIKSDLVPCKIFINGQRRIENEIKIYGSPQYIADVGIYSDKEVDITTIFNANYFLNDRVIELLGKDFKIQRSYIARNVEEITLTNGNRLRYDSGY